MTAFRHFLTGVCLAGAILMAPAALAALDPDETLDDPALEERARALGKELRCVVCQNQAIDDSNAELAQDLRRLVRERLVAGDSDAEIRQFMVDRYGEFVLLKPPMTMQTLLLWAGPFLFLGLGAGMIALNLRRRRGDNAPDELDEEESRRLAAVLRDDPANPEAGRS